MIELLIPLTYLSSVCVLPGAGGVYEFAYNIIKKPNQLRK